MRCPFLREAQVKSCQASTIRKQIVRSAASASDERCVTAEYIHCAAVKQLHEELPSLNRCPFLQESLVQYCSAAPVAKYIPYTDSLASRCGGSRHRYCDVFLSVARPLGGRTERAEREGDVAIPDHLLYTRNHLWIDLHDDNSFQIGIDALLARVFGDIDGVTFLPQKGVGHPAAVFSVFGQDYQVVFPLNIRANGFNSNLRVNPSRCVRDPYGLGWVFEGIDASPFDQKSLTSDPCIMDAQTARDRAREDLQRISALVHEYAGRQEALGMQVLNDGGTVGPDVMKLLPRDEALQLFNEFFSPYASKRS
ncbi:MAG TPA: hypothetical protein VMG09_04875 [Bacteroidota bacterium]|nr:hypothetical protein [Bacteroidota bacterium]